MGFYDCLSKRFTPDTEIKPPKIIRKRLSCSKGTSEYFPITHYLLEGESIMENGNK